MKLVFDTNAYCQCDLNNERALELTERALTLYMPAVVYGELYYGFRHGTRYQYNVNRLDEFIENYGVQVINVDLDVARKFGDIFTSLRKRGKAIPTNDVWIAACCMSVGGVLLTADAHFKYVDQIQTEFL